MARIGMAVRRVWLKNWDPCDALKVLQVERQMERLASESDGLVLVRRAFMAFTAASAAPFPRGGGDRVRPICA